MTIANKLLTVAQNEQAIAEAVEDKRLAIVEKGVPVPVGTPLSQFPAKIGEIEGSGTIPVHFFDTATGKEITTVYVNSGDDATPPPAPTHEHLTFKYWKGVYQNVTREHYVGAIYETDEDATFLFIRIENAIPQTLTLRVWKSAYSNPITIDCGDGTILESTDVGDLVFTHTWPSGGDYKIKISCAVPYKLGNTGNMGVFRDPNGTYNPVLRRIYLPASAQFNPYSVANNYALEAIVISDGITSLSERCFSSDYKTKYMALPDSVTTVGSYLCSYQGKLSVFICSDKITGTLDNLFGGIRSLRYVHLSNKATVLNGVFSYMDILSDIELPSGLVTLGTSAFNSCNTISKLDIPGSVTSIGIQCLYSCPALDYIIVRRTSPPSLASTSLSGNLATLKIYVPDASVAAYKAATNWKVYAEQIFPISQLPA